MQSSLSVVQVTHLFNISPVLEGAVCLVGKQSFDKIVEFILAHIACGLPKNIVHPVGMFCSVSELIVFNHPKSILEGISIYIWVKCISG